MGELFKLPYNAGQTAEREPPERYLLMKPSDVNDDTLIRAMDVLTVIKQHIKRRDRQLYDCDVLANIPEIKTRCMESEVVLGLVWNAIIEYGFNRKPAQGDKQ